MIKYIKSFFKKTTPPVVEVVEEQPVTAGLVVAEQAPQAVWPFPTQGAPTSPEAPQPEPVAKIKPKKPRNPRVRPAP
jgi:hypothetical protein